MSVAVFLTILASRCCSIFAYPRVHKVFPHSFEDFQYDVLVKLYSGNEPAAIVGEARTFCLSSQGFGSLLLKDQLIPLVLFPPGKTIRLEERTVPSGGQASANG